MKNEKCHQCSQTPVVIAHESYIEFEMSMNAFALASMATM